LNNDNHLVYTLHGDGELQEGQNWEAIMYASAKKVDNLIATIDLNGKQIDATDEVLPMGSIRAKFEAFDWDVLDIKEGNNIEAIIAGMKQNPEQEKENQFACYCILKWEWVDFMMNTHAWHGKAPNDAQLENALAQNNNVGGELDY
jgi:transketolase